MIQPRKARAGFTLVELLVVIVVLAALAAIILPRFLNAGLRSKEAALKGDLKLLRDAVSRFHADTSWYPKTLADLAIRTAPAAVLNGGGNEKTIDAAHWKGPYVESVPNDPVSAEPFLYFVENDGGHRVGEVRSSADGTGLDGTPYKAW